MFSDKFQLTKAVLEGRKTMTRRIVPENTPFGNWAETVKKSRYKPGEVVAVAQSYNDCGYDPMLLQQVWVKKPTIFPDLDPYSQLVGWVDLPMKYHKGWSNKMFVLADLMPHQIRITNVRVERLQDISDEDCLKEGIYWDYGDYPYMATKMYKYDGKEEFIHPKAAFAALIDKVFGKGTWESNPWVFCYEFDLVK